MKIKIILYLLFIFTEGLIFSQANPPKYGAGLVNFHQKSPVYDDINGKIIGHLERVSSSTNIFLKQNNGDSIDVKDCLEMSCCDSYLKLIFFQKKNEFINIARSTNNGKGVWLKENITKDSSIKAIPWKSMILDTINYPDEFRFLSKTDSFQLFKTSDLNSSFETLNNNGKWHLKFTGNVKENWIEVIATEKKFEPCYEYHHEDKKQQDLQTKRGYIQCIDNLGLPKIWFLICEM